MLKEPRDPLYPARNVTWTDDFRVELPIRKGIEGIASLEPVTLIDEFRGAVATHADKPALSVKRNNVWVRDWLFSKPSPSRSTSTSVKISQPASSPTDSPNTHPSISSDSTPPNGPSPSTAHFLPARSPQGSTPPTASQSANTLWRTQSARWWSQKTCSMPRST